MYTLIYVRSISGREMGGVGARQAGSWCAHSMLPYHSQFDEFRLMRTRNSLGGPRTAISIKVVVVWPRKKASASPENADVRDNWVCKIWRQNSKEQFYTYFGVMKCLFVCWDFFFILIFFCWVWMTSLAVICSPVKYASPFSRLYPLPRPTLSVCFCSRPYPEFCPPLPWVFAAKFCAFLENFSKRKKIN